MNKLFTTLAMILTFSTASFGEAKSNTPLMPTAFNGSYTLVSETKEIQFGDCKNMPCDKDIHVWASATALEIDVNVNTQGYVTLNSAYEEYVFDQTWRLISYDKDYDNYFVKYKATYAPGMLVIEQEGSHNSTDLKRIATYREQMTLVLVAGGLRTITHRSVFRPDGVLMYQVRLEQLFSK